MSEKLRGCLIVLVVLIVGAVGIYYGARGAYYQGWWGKNNRVARYLWLCDAPAEFEGTLYPEGMEILLPACENLLGRTGYHRFVFFSSDRQYIAVNKVQGYDWIDLRTGNITTTEPTDVTLEECITHEVTEITSLDGRRIAKQDGIYDAQSGERILDYGLKLDSDACRSPHKFYPCTWLQDNQGVVLVPNAVPWGLELLVTGDCYLDLPTSNYPVPQPVLKFNVPEAYR